jgi:hypothetical protein
MCIEHINQNFMNASQPTRQLSSISHSPHHSPREVDVECDAKGTNNKKARELKTRRSSHPSKP